MSAHGNPIRRTTLAGIIVFSVALAAPFAAMPQIHDHASAGEPKLVLDHGKKWRTDAPLRTGMENIRAAIAADLPAIHDGTESAERYAALAAKVNGEVAFIVQNCKLDKAADEQLHIVIAELLGGADAMQGKADARDKGAQRVVDALNAYGRYFEHPRWRHFGD